MKYFDNVTNLDELKKAYRRLAQIHHPDCGGDEETMKAINNEHDELFEVLKKQHNTAADEYHQTTETAEEFREIITALLKLDGLEVELCGSWLWIGGDTKANKDALKALGCRWSSNKKLWYWGAGRKWHRGNATMSDIRTKYGSQSFRGSREYGKYTQLDGATA